MLISSALVLSTSLMGLAAIPHCALMCGAPCAALAPAGRQQLGFQTLRLLSYATAGALAAASVGWLRESVQLTQTLRPLWTLIHVGLLALGLWLLVAAQLPAWLGRWGRKPGASKRWGWTAGALWGAWPCGLLQAALLVAALADHPLGGAAAMAAFALVSGPGLLWAPLWLKRLRGGREGTLPIRLAGAALVAAALFALGHGLWARFVEWCSQAF